MRFDTARWKPAALLPRPDLRDASLVFVVTVLVFLACLTALGALSAHRAASGWSSQLQGSATVVVRPRGVESVDAAAAKAAEALAAVKGVTEAQALEKDKAEALLEPWIGREALTADLPVPRLVTVDTDRGAPPTTAALEGALRAAGVDATVDDHRLWIADIERAAASVRWAALAIFALIALTAAAVIAFATRVGLVAHHETIEVLHLYGAKPSFISRLFELRFAAVAVVAGLLGAGLAAIIGAVVRLVGGGEGITPVLPVAWIDLAWLAPAPLVAATIAALAAQRTAVGLLKEMG